MSGVTHYNQGVMSEMSEDDLLTTFRRLNIRIGDINPCSIKAWFDTDCDDLLKWMCSSISDYCYVSPQEQHEYAALSCVFTNDQLNEHIEMIEAEFPDFFQTELNVCNIDIANSIIQIYEEQQRDCDQHLRINQNLNEHLLKEYSKLSSEEMRSQLDQESAQEFCEKLSIQLDEINYQIFHQMLQYRGHLSNYKLAGASVFVNNSDFKETEQNLNIITSFHMDVKFDNDLLTEKHINTVSALGARIFDSRINNLVIQMEIEGLQSILNCLKYHDFDSLLSLNVRDSIESSININSEQQKSMLEEAELVKLALIEHYINGFAVKCSKSELNFLLSKSKYFFRFCDIVTKVFLYLITICNVLIQEKSDISNSNQFFRNISRYINYDLQISSFRKRDMLNVISNYESFCSKLTNDIFNLADDFKRLLFEGKNLSIVEVVEKTALLRSTKENLKQTYTSKMIDRIKLLPKTDVMVRILQDFLMSDATHQISIVPCRLQIACNDINKKIGLQNAARNFLSEMAYKMKVGNQFRNNRQTKTNVC